MHSNNFSFLRSCGWKILTAGVLFVGTSFLTMPTSNGNSVGDVYIGTYCMDTALVASVIFGECGICPISEQYKTGSVVINRWKHGNRGERLQDIIYANKQFHAVHPDSALRYDRIQYNIARDLLLGKNVSSHIRFFSKNVNFFKRYKIDIWYKEKYHYFGA